MTAELVRGQNHPLPDTRLEIRVSAGHPVVACATCADERGTVRDEWIAHPGAPTLPGVEVSRQATEAPRFTVDLDAVPEAVHQVNVLLALPEGSGGPAHFGATAAPFVAVTGRDGAELASFTITGLDAETALVAVELYRRQGAWKVRAVGQGYAGGLARAAGRPGAGRRPARRPRHPGGGGAAHARAEPAQLRTRAADGAYTQAATSPRAATSRPRARSGRHASRRPPGPRPAARRSTGPQQTPTPDAPPSTGRAHRLRAPAPPVGRAPAAAPGRAARPAGSAGRARRGRRHRLVHGGAALQPDLGHVRGSGPQRRRVPQRRRLRRVPDGPGARPGRCPTRAAGSAAPGTPPARRPAPSASS